MVILYVEEQKYSQWFGRGIKQQQYDSKPLNAIFFIFFLLILSMHGFSATKNKRDTRTSQEENDEKVAS